MGIENPWEKLNCGTDSSSRTIWLNRRTKAMYDEVVRRTGLDLVIVQGSYNAGVSESAGTHDAGAVLDVRSWNLTAAQLDEAILVARRVGFAAWARTTAQGFDPHQHWVAVADEKQSPECHAQEVDYLNRRNGLASHAPDDGPWLTPIPIFNYPKWLREQDDMALDDKIPGANGQTVADALKAALASKRVLDRLAENSGARQTAIREQLEKLVAEVAALPDGTSVAKTREVVRRNADAIKAHMDELDQEEPPPMKPPVPEEIPA